MYSYLLCTSPKFPLRRGGEYSNKCIFAPNDLIGSADHRNSSLQNWTTSNSTTPLTPCSYSEITAVRSYKLSAWNWKVRREQITNNNSSQSFRGGWKTIDRKFRGTRVTNGAEVLAKCPGIRRARIVVVYRRRLLRSMQLWFRATGSWGRTQDITRNRNCGAVAKNLRIYTPSIMRTNLCSLIAPNIEESWQGPNTHRRYRLYVYYYVIWTDNGSTSPEADTQRQEGKYPMIKVLQGCILK